MSRRRVCRRIRAPAVECPIKESITAKLFTVDEANAQVPRLVMLLERLQRSALRLDEERRSVAAARGVDPRDVSPRGGRAHRGAGGARA